MFTVTDAACGADVLAGQLTLNRVCLHLGSVYYAGAEALARELACLNVGEGITFADTWSSIRIYVRRAA